MSYAVGIDLGTTYSAIAVLDESGKPVVVANSDGNSVTPSVVCFRDGSIIVGESAKEMQGLGMWPVAAYFKRQMGDAAFVFSADGVDYSATDLSSLVLKKLKQDAEVRLGGPVSHAVITVPAYFRDVERKATIAAGRLAGLEVLQVVNEPTAAAIAYGMGRSITQGKVLVFDLGGGTFDVTLVELGDEGVRVLTSDGNHQLGGKDWDERIVEFMAQQFREEFGRDPLAEADTVADLLHQAEQAKKRLSASNSTMVSITHDGERGRYTLTREKFEELTRDLLEGTRMLTRRVLDSMRVRAEDLTGVILVGGSTRMPMVRDFVERLAGRPPLAGVNVDEAVAVGAALLAAERRPETLGGSVVHALGGPVRAVDVTNHSLGMIAVSPDQSRYVNSIILPKNRPIPCSEARPYQFRTRKRGGNRLEIFMTQGETASPENATYIGLYVIEDIPHVADGISVVEVTYHYDLSGSVQVTAMVKGQPAALPVSIEPLPPDVPARFLGPPAQAVVQEHLSVYMAFDLSGSMSGRPLEEAKRAAAGFLHNIDLAHCSMGIIAFSDRTATKLHACQDAREIERAIDGLEVCETGVGNLHDPFGEVFSLLSDVKGRRFAIILTDGVWCNQQRAIEAARRCHQQEIEVIAIGFGGADREFLRAIASSDEGSLFTSMEHLFETFSTIAQVITETGGGAGLVTEGSPRSDARRGFLSGIREALRK